MWRLSNPEFNSQSGARGRAAEVWADAEILFGKSQERYLFWLAVIRRIKETSADDTGTDGGKVRSAGGADGEAGRGDRAVKGVRSDALGAENE